MPFVVESGAADEDDRADAPVRLFLLQSSSEAVDTRIAVEAEGAGTIGNSVPIREHEHRRLRQLGEERTDDGFHDRRENKFRAQL